MAKFKTRPFDATNKTKAIRTLITERSKIRANKRSAYDAKVEAKRREMLK